jgi:hypothetical protein
LSALRAGRTSPPGFFIFKDSRYTFLLEAESTPGPVRPVGLGQFKKSTSLGLEPATFRLAAKCLNHYATACPLNNSRKFFLHRLEKKERRYACRLLGTNSLKEGACDIITEEISVTRLRHSKQPISATKIAHATIKELWETVFSVAQR